MSEGRSQSSGDRSQEEWRITEYVVGTIVSQFFRIYLESAVILACEGN